MGSTRECNQTPGSMEEEENPTPCNSFARQTLEDVMATCVQSGHAPPSLEVVNETEIESLIAKLENELPHSVQVLSRLRNRAHSRPPEQVLKVLRPSGHPGTSVVLLIAEDWLQRPGMPAQLTLELYARPGCEEDLRSALLACNPVPARAPAPGPGPGLGTLDQALLPAVHYAPSALLPLCKELLVRRGWGDDHYEHLLLWLPCDVAANLPDCTPPGWSVRPLEARHAPLADWVWRWRFPGAENFLRHCIQHYPGCWGAFPSEDDACPQSLVVCDPWGELTNLYTHSAVRGRGLARAVLTAACRQLGRAGRAPCAIVYTPNPQSEGLLTGLGFQVVDRVFWVGQSFDALR